jgi:hypothetical protein
MGKKSKSRSGISIPDHNSESFETFFGLKILKFLELIWIRDPDLFDPGSGIWKNLDPG